MKIERMYGDVRKQLVAGCYFGEWTDVGIIQYYHMPNGEVRVQSIEMSVDEAEALLAALPGIIGEAHEMINGYMEAMRKESEEG